MAGKATGGNGGYWRVVEGTGGNGGYWRVVGGKGN